MPVFVDGDIVEVFGDIPALRGPVRLSARRGASAGRRAAGRGIRGRRPSHRSAARLAVGLVRCRRAGARRRAAGTVPRPRSLREARPTRCRSAAVVQLEYVSAAARTAVLPRGRAAGAVRRAGRLVPDRVVPKRAGHGGPSESTASARPTVDRRALRVFGGGRRPAPPEAVRPGGLPRARVAFDSGRELRRPRVAGRRGRCTADDGGLIVSVPYAGTAWIARMVVAQLGVRPRSSSRRKCARRSAVSRGQLLEA